MNDLMPTKNRFAQITSDLTFAGALLVLLGYGAGLDGLFRPIEGGPATHPLTVLLFVISAVVTHGLISPQKPLPIFMKLIFVGLVLSGFRLVEGLLGVSYTPDLLNEKLPTDFAWNNETGINTALFFVSYFLMMLAHATSYNVIGRLTQIVALSTLVITLAGYSLKLPVLYGHMSASTLALGAIQLASGLSLKTQQT